MVETLEYQDAPVYSYPLASADMRYIEVGERVVFLRKDPKLGLVYRGEISGCGPDCFVKLNEILLEYAMSCEGCREENTATNEVINFGEHLGRELAGKTIDDTAGLPTSEKLSTTFRCVLNSMGADYIEEINKDQLVYSLDCCPISDCAKDTGFNRSVEMAHLSFVALSKSVIKALAPDWVLLEPSDKENDIPIHKIVISSS